MDANKRCRLAAPFAYEDRDVLTANLWLERSDLRLYAAKVG